MAGIQENRLEGDGDNPTESDATLIDVTEQFENVTTGPTSNPKPKANPNPKREDRGEGEPRPRQQKGFPKHFPFNSNILPRADGSPILINQIGNAGNVQIGHTYIGSTFTNQTVISSHTNPRTQPTQPPQPTPKVVVPKDILSSEAKVSRKAIDVVSEHLGIKWKSVSRHLGFSEGQIQSFIIDSSAYGIKESVINMLNKWIEETGSKATIGKLSEALDAREAGDVALKLAPYI